MAFRLTSPAFDEGGDIPTRFTCDGEGVSPPLEWEDAPDGTAAFALLVDDPDARDFAHWVLWDVVGARSGGLAEGIASSPDAPRQGRNDFGRIGWGGPCPPSGTHRYRFALLALDGMLGIATEPGIDDIRAAVAGHVLAEATLHGAYTRRR